MHTHAYAGLSSPRGGNGGGGEVWNEPASPYSTPYPGPLTPSFFPPPSPYSYLDPPLEVAPPPPLYPPTFGMGPWSPAQLVCSACAVQWAVVVTAAPPVPCASVGDFLPCTLSPRAPVGSPSGQSPPFTKSPCVRWSRSTHTADSLHPTHRSDGTFTAQTGECGKGGRDKSGDESVCTKLYVCSCVCSLLSALRLPLQLQSVQSTASRTTQEVCSPASGSEVRSYNTQRHVCMPH